MVPNVSFEVNITGYTATVILTWKAAFNNFDPIVNYTVSCSNSARCPGSFNVTDSTGRNYTISNLTPNTHYTFSVVATNSIGSGEVGVVNVTTPGKVTVRMYIPTCRNLSVNSHSFYSSHSRIIASGCSANTVINTALG